MQSDGLTVASMMAPAPLLHQSGVAIGAGSAGAPVSSVRAAKPGSAAPSGQTTLPPGRTTLPAGAQLSSGARPAGQPMLMAAALIGHGAVTARQFSGPGAQGLSLSSR